MVSHVPPCDTCTQSGSLWLRSICQTFQFTVQPMESADILWKHTCHSSPKHSYGSDAASSSTSLDLRSTRAAVSPSPRSLGMRHSNSSCWSAGWLRTPQLCFPAHAHLHACTSTGLPVHLPMSALPVQPRLLSVRAAPAPVHVAGCTAQVPAEPGKTLAALLRLRLAVPVSCPGQQASSHQTPSSQQTSPLGSAWYLGRHLCP